MKIILTQSVNGGIIPNTPILVPDQPAGAVGELVGPHPLHPREYIVEIDGNRYAVTREAFDYLH